MNVMVKEFQPTNSEATMVKGYLDTSQAAERLGVHRRTINRWVLEGDIFPNAIPINPKAKKSQWLIPVSDIVAFEQERGQQDFSENSNGKSN